MATPRRRTNSENDFIGLASSISGGRLEKLCLLLYDPVAVQIVAIRGENKQANRVDSVDFAEHADDSGCPRNPSIPIVRGVSMVTRPNAAGSFNSRRKRCR